MGSGAAETEEVFTPPPPGHIPPSLPLTNLIMITWGSIFLLDRFTSQQTPVLSLLHGLHQVNTAFVASVLTLGKSDSYVGRGGAWLSSWHLTVRCSALAVPCHCCPRNPSLQHDGGMC